MAVTARIRDKVQRHLGEDADDDLFAHAMTHICEGYPPACSAAFTCIYDGDCFKGDPAVAAARAIEGLAEKHDGTVRQYILSAARMVRNGGADIASAKVLPFETTANPATQTSNIKDNPANGR